MNERETMIYTLFACGLIAFLTAVIIIFLAVSGIIAKDVWTAVSIISMIAAMAVLFATAVTQPQIK